METDQAPSPFVIATYEEIRLRFSLGGTDQARIKAKRRGWEPEPPNHPGAITRIRVPRAAWDGAGEDDRSAPIDQERSRGTDQKRRPNKDMGGILATLKEEIDRLRTERDAAIEQARAVQHRLEEERVRGEEARIKAAASEAREGELRLSLVREVERANQVEAARRGAEEELADWVAGGPLTRAWHAFLSRRGKR